MHEICEYLFLFLLINKSMYADLLPFSVIFPGLLFLEFLSSTDYFIFYNYKALLWWRAFYISLNIKLNFIYLLKLRDTFYNTDYQYRQHDFNISNYLKTLHLRIKLFIFFFCYFCFLLLSRSILTITEFILLSDNLFFSIKVHWQYFWISFNHSFLSLFF